MDIEKGAKDSEVRPVDARSNSPEQGTVETTDGEEYSSFLARFARWTAWTGAEQRGAAPVPIEERTHTDYISIMTVFGTPMTSLLPVGIGSITTMGYGMPITTAALMTCFLQLLMAIPAGYVITLAPRTGMRQMVQFRYCFGKYGNVLTAAINAITVGGYAMSGSITGGQVLSRVQDGALPVAGGISVILIIGMILGFLGYKFIHQVLRWYWIVSLAGLIVLAGAASPQLRHQAPEAQHPPQAYLGMVALAAGNMISWANVVGDYACYMPPSTPKLRIGMYCAFGITLPFSLLMVLGAAIGGAVPQIPSWSASYETGGLGGVIGTLLVERLGNFGRFVLVVLGMSVFGTVTRDIYSITITLPTIVPVLRRVPRVLLAIVASGVLIAIAIPASRSFIDTIKTFLGVVGYYVGGSISCFVIEMAYFRKSRVLDMDPRIWDDFQSLPSGWPAVVSTLVPWALVIPSMETSWYTGPIAKVTGDLGFEFAMVIAILCYIPLRSYEIRQRGHLNGRGWIKD